MNIQMAKLRLLCEGCKTALFEVKMPELYDFPVLDIHFLIENLDYDLDTTRELVELFLSTFTGHGEALVEKLGGDDLKDILECAHSLKGAVANIGGQRLAEIARQIQELCHEGIKPDCAEWVPLVAAQTGALKNALEQLDWSELEQFVAERQD